MKQISWLISKYLVDAILPYFAFSWLLLSVILFVQQASRFSDIFFSVNIPASLIWQLTIALIPNVIAFTCPMAMLVGTIIGLSKMQGDSELVAIRAAGVGNVQIAVPIVILGILLSIFAFVVNLKGVPIAAAIVRSVALQTAIKKLESPVEPGVFNTELAGYTIYVKGGDVATGRWNNIFIYNDDTANNATRLITSRSGRIDVTDQLSELVLENATVSTIPNLPEAGKYVAENIGEVRLAIKTRRGELIDKLSNSAGTPEELGLSQLSDYANSKDGKDRTEAQILWQRRITLSITPFIFCLLGTAMILRFSRGGRGLGVFLALVGLIGYYLLAFAGEQLARTGKIGVFAGGLIPIVASFIAIIWFAFSNRINLSSGTGDRVTSFVSKFRPQIGRIQAGSLFAYLTTGLRDLDLVFNLIKYFLLTFGFLTAVFIIFTAFELWKFAGTIDGGLWLLTKYLFFLLPFIYLQIAPSAAMVGTLATYVIKSRQNEIVTWTSAGQSVYRLLVPCFVLMALLGIINWQVQERLMPRANQLQDEIRTQIRKGGVVTPTSGRYWVANDKRIYSFELAGATDTRLARNQNAFDNEKLLASVVSSGSDAELISPTSDEFACNNEKVIIIPAITEEAAAPILHLEGGLASDNVNGIDSAILNREVVASSRFSTRTYASDNEILIDSVINYGNASNSPSTHRLVSDNELRDSLDESSITISAIGLRSIDSSCRLPSSPFLLFSQPSILAVIVASDNEKRVDDRSAGGVKNLVVYEFSTDGSRLQTLYRAPFAVWGRDKVSMSGNIERSELSEGKITTTTFSGGELAEDSNPFAGVRGKPSHLNISELKSRLAETDSEVESRNFAVAIQKRYSTLILPLIIGLFTAPFALSLSRKGKVVTVGYAIGLWLLFMGITNTFAQFGESGSLSAATAVWSPLVIFAMFGVFLLSKVRT